MLLGAFTFWVMDHGTQEANLQSRLEPKKELKPLVTAPMKPRGGGMIELQPPVNATPSNSTNAPPPLLPVVLPPPTVSSRAAGVPPISEGVLPMSKASTQANRSITTPAR